MASADTPTVPETATAVVEAAPAINELPAVQEAKTPATRERSRKASKSGPPALAAQLERRRWRRKHDLMDPDGLAREHIRLIAAVQTGRMSVERGDTLSRMYGRQADMIFKRKRTRYLRQLTVIYGQHHQDGQALPDISGVFGDLFEQEGAKK